jgi:hypothetical protein
MNLFISYVRNQDRIKREYEKLKIKFDENNFIIAPHALIRADKKSKDEINKTYLPQIEKYYKENDKTVSMILLVFSEVLLNFWEHAKNDTQSIIVAHGNKQRIEIACADTGDGIISTLGSTLAKDEKKISPVNILLKSLEKGITSKASTNHMGYGLWILNQLATITKGRIALYSQGAYYSNDGGAVQNGQCGFWKGTIISIALPLNNPKTLEDIENKGDHMDIKINWK